MRRDKTACNCRNITYGDIYDAVRAGASDAKAVEEKTGYARGCGRCREFIECLVREFLEEE